MDFKKSESTFSDRLQRGNIQFGFKSSEWVSSAALWDVLVSRAGSAEAWGVFEDVDGRNELTMSKLWLCWSILVFRAMQIFSFLWWGIIRIFLDLSSNTHSSPVCRKWVNWRSDSPVRVSSSEREQRASDRQEGVVCATRQSKVTCNMWNIFACQAAIHTQLVLNTYYKWHVDIWGWS